MKDQRILKEDAVNALASTLDWLHRTGPKSEEEWSDAEESMARVLAWIRSMRRATEFIAARIAAEENQTPDPRPSGRGP